MNICCKKACSRTEKLYQIWSDNKQPFLTAMIVGAVIQFSIYGYGLMNPDAMWLGEKYIADWEIMLGRWGLEIFDYLHFGVNAPIIISAITLFWYSIAGILVGKIYGTTDKSICTITALMIVSTPMVAVTITYYYCADAYAVSFCLAVIAIWLLKKNGNIKIQLLFSTLCITCSLSIYQGNLGVAAGLGVLMLIFQAFRENNNFRKLIRDTFYLSFVLLVGTGLYYIILQIILKIRGLSMMSYKGANNIGIRYILLNLMRSIHNAYYDFFEFFSQNSIMINSYVIRLIYLMLLILFIGILIYRLTIQHIGIPNVAIAMLGIALLPVASNIIDIVAPDTQIILLTSGGLTILPAAVFALCSVLVASEPITMGNGLERKLKCLLSMVAILAVANYALIVNTDGIVMKQEQDKTIALANRICMEIEQKIDPTMESLVMIAGSPLNGNYPTTSTLEDKANHYAKWGLTWATPDGSYNCWKQVFRRCLGVVPNWCSEDQFRETVQSKQFKNMPNYPSDGSINKINNIIVIKISDIEELA